MAQVLVRNLDEETVAQLKKRAAENGRSLQAELKLLLEQAVRPDGMDTWQRVKQFRAKMKQAQRNFSDSARLIREDRKRWGPMLLIPALPLNGSCQKSTVRRPYGSMPQLIDCTSPHSQLWSWETSCAKRSDATR